MGIGDVKRTDAKASIHAGAYYMAELRAGWTAERTEQQRMELTQASYNAGFGNILKAQRLCKNELVWKDISPCLILVTKHHSRETIGYVERIWRYWKQWKLS